MGWVSSRGKSKSSQQSAGGGCGSLWNAFFLAPSMVFLPGLSWTLGLPPSPSELNKEINKPRC